MFSPLWDFYKHRPLKGLGSFGWFLFISSLLCLKTVAKARTYFRTDHPLLFTGCSSSLLWQLPSVVGSSYLHHQTKSTTYFYFDHCGEGPFPGAKNHFHRVCAQLTRCHIIDRPTSIFGLLSAPPLRLPKPTGWKSWASGSHLTESIILPFYFAVLSPFTSGVWGWFTQCYPMFCCSVLCYLLHSQYILKFDIRVCVYLDLNLEIRQ